MSRIPLLEVAFEIRFEPENNLATSLLLETNNQFPNAIKVANSEGSKIPEEVKIHQNELYYVPSYRVVYEDFSLLISDGSLVVLKNFLTGQYEGWEKFKPIILKLIHILETSNKINEVQRYSLKYTNLFDEDCLHNNALDFNVSLGKKNYNFEDNFEIRTEYVNESYITMLRACSQIGVINTCDIDGQERQLTGFLLVIDLIANIEFFDINSTEKNLEELHMRVYKEFRNIYPDNKKD